MELRQLRYFVAVVEEETVTAAARKLNMTQPPLTAQLKLLEKELNCSLFQRKGRRLQVTEAGRHFYQKASAILGMCDAAAMEMREYDSGAAGTLQIGVVSSVQEGMFTKWLTAFAGQYPEIRYEIYSANTYQLLEQVRTGQLDLAVVRTPFSARDIGQKVLGEESCHKLPEIRRKAAFIGAYDLVGAEAALPVDKPQQHEPLGHGHGAYVLFEEPEELPFHIVDVAGALRPLGHIGGYGAVDLTHHVPADQGVGIYLVEIVDKTVVAAPVPVAHPAVLRQHPGGVDGVAEDCVASVLHPVFHRGAAELAHLLRVRALEAGQQGQQYDAESFHDNRTKLSH